MKQLVIVLLLFNSAIFSQEKSFWIKNFEINHDGISRYFDVFIPLILNKNPELVIQLHGGTQSKDKIYDGEDSASKYWKEVAEKNNFLLIVPNGTDLSTGLSKGDNLNWNDCRMPIKNDKQADDVGFISKIIDWSIANYNVNDKKVYVTGVSNGGFMSYRLALEIPTKITAIAAFAANFPKESECDPSGIAIPVMIVNGKKDMFIPFDGGITKFRKEAILSSQQTVDFWVKNNFQGNYFPKIEITKLGRGSKKRITYTIYDSENSKSQIRYYQIENGGHTMPGKKYVLSKFSQKIIGKQNQDIEGAEFAWEFFKSVSK